MERREWAQQSTMHTKGILPTKEEKEASGHPITTKKEQAKDEWDSKGWKIQIQCDGVVMCVTGFLRGSTHGLRLRGLPNLSF